MIPTPGVRLHWGRGRRDPENAVESVLDSLLIAVRCLDLRAAVVVLDSALEKRLVTMGELEAVFAHVPRGLRLLTYADARSGSGIATLARLALRRLRLRVRCQVWIPGVGRVDLLIGDRLILELDGDAWHTGRDAVDRDRRRDRISVVGGYLVLRASYDTVMHDWPTLEAEILTLVRRREHLWSARYGRAGT